MVFYWRVADNKFFIMDDYWVFIPMSLVVNGLIAKKLDKRIKKKLQKRREEEELRRALELSRKREKIRRIALVTVGLGVSSGLSALTFFANCRGGASSGFYLDIDDEKAFEEYIYGKKPTIFDVDYLYDKCIESGAIKRNERKGVYFLDSSTLRKTIHQLYRHRRKGRIIYMTITGLCCLVAKRGQTGLSIGPMTYLRDAATLFKALTSIAVGTNLIWLVLGQLPEYKSIAIKSATFSVLAGITSHYFAMRYTEIGLSLAPYNTPEEIANAKPRIPGEDDVLVLDYRDRDEVTTTEYRKDRGECWIPTQRETNPNCKRTITLRAADTRPSGLKYEEVASVKDVSMLSGPDNDWVFSDIQDLGGHSTELKSVDFSKKFEDMFTPEVSETMGSFPEFNSQSKE